MKTKMFEVRDVATFIPVLAIQMEPTCDTERYLLARTGYGRSPAEQARYVFVARVAGGRGGATCDPYDWADGSRTMQVAHQHILENFDTLETGAVVDVQFILGMKPSPAMAERIETALGLDET